MDQDECGPPGKMYTDPMVYPMGVVLLCPKYCDKGSQTSSEQNADVFLSVVQGSESDTNSNLSLYVKAFHLQLLQ